MLPDWLKEADEYTPQGGGNSFALKTIKSLGAAFSRLKVQRGHEKGRALPALVKLLLAVCLIISVAVVHNRLFLMAVAAFLLMYLATWPARDIVSILRGALTAAVIAFVIFLPAMLMKPAGAANNLQVVAKVFLSVTALEIFNHTTQWNHITGALRKLKLPGIFIFTLDITLKYIVLLGNLIVDLLTALGLRSVGKNNRKYTSVGGVMGVTFVRSTKLSTEMYEAMQCRGFTDDYEAVGGVVDAGGNDTEDVTECNFEAAGGTVDTGGNDADKVQTDKAQA